jgi:hypothetical protein
MSQALFEVPFDAASRLPLLPRAASGGEYTLFDSGPVQGWCLCYDVDGAPPTVTVRIATSAAALITLKAHPDLLWLADVGSPVKDGAVNATTAQAARDWLRNHGYSGAAFGAAMAAVHSARSRRALAGAVIETLHGARLDQIERTHIGEET